MGDLGGGSGSNLGFPDILLAVLVQRYVFSALIFCKFNEVEIMSSQTPLQGMDLISCAQANIKQGIEEAAFQCGYSQDAQLFIDALERACQDIGIAIDDVTQLGKQDAEVEARGVIVAPDSQGHL
jgi:hypothetical protein